MTTIENFSDQSFEENTAEVRLDSTSTEWDESHRDLYRVESKVRHGLDWCDSVKEEKTRLSKHQQHLVAYCESQEEEPSWAELVRGLDEPSTPEERVAVCKQLAAADDFPDAAATCLLRDEYVQAAKAEIAKEYRQELLNVVIPDLDVGRLDPSLTITSVFERLKWRRFVERKICEAIQEFSDCEAESLLEEDTFGFWGQYRLGYLQLLELRNPPLEPWQLEIATEVSQTYQGGPAIRRFGFRVVGEDGVAFDLPTLVDMCSKDLDPLPDRRDSLILLSDAFTRMAEEPVLFLIRDRTDHIALQVDVDIDGHEASARMDFIKEPSLI